MPTPVHLHSNLEEYTLPSSEVLLASTLALMTGYMQDGGCSHRGTMAAKIVSNLVVLSQDALLSPGFQTLLWSLRGRWLNQAPVDAVVSMAATERHLWHASPGVLQ